MTPSTIAPTKARMMARPPRYGMGSVWTFRAAGMSTMSRRSATFLATGVASSAPTSAAAKAAA